MFSYSDLARTWNADPTAARMHALVVEAIDALDDDERQAMLAPLVASKIRMAARALTRTAERRAAPGRQDPGYDFSQLNDIVAQHEDGLREQWAAGLLASTFTVDGSIVSWGSATVEQHGRRADALRRQASGTVQTAQRHELAARQCDERGAACLNDAMVDAA